MKISVFTDQKKLRLVLPTSLVVSRVGVCFMRKTDGSAVWEALTPSCLRRLRREIRRAKKRNPGWIFFEVDAPGGTRVEIEP